MSLTGSSQEIPLVDVLQVQANNRTTCRIAVRADTGEGDLFLDQGEVVHARCGDDRGDEAAYRLLAGDDARYRVEAGVRAPERTMHVSCQHLVLETARRADEAARRRVARGWIAPSPTAPTPMLGHDPADDERSRRWRRWCGLAGIAVTLVVLGAVVARWTAPSSDRAAAAQPATVTAAAAVAPVEAIALVGPDDVAPVPLDMRPAQPPQRSALSPTIVCRVLIDEHGAVRDAKVYRSRLDLVAWEDAALDAVATWRFSPAKRDGAVVPAWLNVPVSFSTAATVPVRLSVKGSDTIGGEHGVGPVLAAAYMEAHPGVEVVWEGLGSGTGFAGLLDGSADLGASSRSVDGKELAEAERLGVQLTEYVLGYDGIAIVVHPDAPVRELTLEQASQIFAGELDSWAQLGGPDRPIRRISRPSYSGTHVFFRDKVLRRDGSERDFAGDTEWVESSEQIVADIAADPLAISYVGLGWVAPTVRALPVTASAAAPAIAPSVATVRDGSYPIYRPLLLYSRGAPSPAVADLLRFCLSRDGQALLADRGFVPGDLPDEQVAAITGSDTPGNDAAPEVAARLEFAHGRTVLDRRSRSALWALAGKLRDNPRRVLVIGHADAGGDASDNAAMARRRADAVAAYLRRAGVDPALITTESASDASPVASNDTAAGRNRNRRVDVLVAP